MPQQRMRALMTTMQGRHPIWESLLLPPPLTAHDAAEVEMMSQTGEKQQREAQKSGQQQPEEQM